jgi:hypothetical protein
MDKSNQRELLLSIAKENNIDPAIPKNWYGITLEMVTAQKVSHSYLFCRNLMCIRVESKFCNCMITSLVK